MLLIFSVALFFAAIAFFFFTFSAEEHTLSSRLKKNGAMISGIDMFALEKNSKQDGAITGILGESVVKIRMAENMDADAAKRYVESQLTLLRSIFEPNLPPYPEFLTKEAGCADEYAPREHETPYGTYAVLYAGERFGFGVCVEDLIQYRASIGFFYCPRSRTVFEVRYFIPKEKEEGDSELARLNESFQCT